MMKAYEGQPLAGVAGPHRVLKPEALRANGAARARGSECWVALLSRNNGDGASFSPRNTGGFAW